MDHPDANDRPRERAHLVVLSAATVAGAYACYRLVVPFVPALAWALTFAVLFAPVHRRIEARFKRPTLAATLSVVVVAAIVVVPGILVSGRLIAEAAHGALVIRTAIESGQWQQALDAHPRIAPVADWVARQVDLPALIAAAASWLTNTSASFVRGSVAQALGFVLTFYFLFYFLRDRRAAIASMTRLLPLSKAELDRIGARVADTIHATFYGTIVCAVVQGALGGLMFWWLGLQAPLLWGVMMALLAIVPVFGAFVVWIPAALFLAVDGHWWQALILIVWGGVVIGGIDNVIYPILVGNRLRLHTLLAFVAVVGGLVVFGASGVVLGPLVVTVTLTLLEIWQLRALPPTSESPAVSPSWESPPARLPR